jgi:hypothetical protein
MSADLAPLPTTVRERRFLVVWQRPDRTFVPVGQLDVRRDEQDVAHSSFRYLPRAAAETDFQPFLAFPDVDQVYERNGALFPFFANRVMSPRRPDFAQYVTALGLASDEADPLEILARSGGERATDTIHVVPFPERDGNVEWRHFLVSGVRHQPGAQERIARLAEGDQLHLRAEPDNKKNRQAMLLDVERDQPVGWLPDYLLPEFHAHLDAGHTPAVYVVKANGPEVPWHLRLLCRLEMTLS